LLVFIWMYFESRSVASWVTRSQLIGCGGGACVTPCDSAGSRLGVADGEAAIAGPEIAKQKSVQNAAIAIEDARVMERRGKTLITP